MPPDSVCMDGEILITAFTPFPGVAENPTETLLRSLPDCEDRVLRRARHLLLPTEYGVAPRLLAAALDPAPQAILMTGYSARAGGMVLESRATNVCLPGQPDAAGQFPPSLAGAAESIDTPVELHDLAERLMANGIAAQVSRDAGAYVCNHVYHSALAGPCADPAGPIGLFVHVPALKGSALAETSVADMPLADMQRAIGLIARHLLATDRKSRRVITDS